VTVCCLLVVGLPLDRIGYNARVQSLALLPWSELTRFGILRSGAMGAVALLCGLLWASTPRGREGRLWLLIAVTMTMVGIFAVGSNRVTAAQFADAFDGRAAGWVDDALPDGSEAVIVWDQRPGSRKSGDADALDFSVMVTEVLNDSVGTVYRIGRPTYYESVLPTVPARVRADGTLTDAGGTPVTAAYALVTCRAPVRGDALVGAPSGDLELMRVRGPLRLGAARPCRE
jgi:hypothetical protein